MPRNDTSSPLPPNSAAPAAQRPGQAPDYGPVELAAALHGAVARIGAGGPSAAGLVRIRRLARSRRRRRVIMTGGLGVLLAALTASAIHPVHSRTRG